MQVVARLLIAGIKAVSDRQLIQRAIRIPGERSDHRGAIHGVLILLHAPRIGVRGEGGAQTYAFWAFVCASSGVQWISCLGTKIAVNVSMLRTAEETRGRLPPRLSSPAKHGALGNADI